MQPIPIDEKYRKNLLPTKLHYSSKPDFFVEGIENY